MFMYALRERSNLNPEMCTTRVFVNKWLFVYLCIESSHFMDNIYTKKDKSTQWFEVNVFIIFCLVMMGKESIEGLHHSEDKIHKYFYSHLKNALKYSDITILSKNLVN